MARKLRRIFGKSVGIFCIIFAVSFLLSGCDLLDSIKKIMPDREEKKQSTSTQKDNITIKIYGEKGSPEETLANLIFDVIKNRKNQDITAERVDKADLANVRILPFNPQKLEKDGSTYTLEKELLVVSQPSKTDLSNDNDEDVFVEKFIKEPKLVLRYDVSDTGNPDLLAKVKNKIKSINTVPEKLKQMELGEEYFSLQGIQSGSEVLWLISKVKYDDLRKKNSNNQYSIKLLTVPSKFLIWLRPGVPDKPIKDLLAANELKAKGLLILPDKSKPASPASVKGKDLNGGIDVGKILTETLQKQNEKMQEHESSWLIHWRTIAITIIFTLLFVALGFWALGGEDKEALSEKERTAMDLKQLKKRMESFDFSTMAAQAANKPANIGRVESDLARMERRISDLEKWKYSRDAITDVISTPSLPSEAARKSSKYSREKVPVVPTLQGFEDEVKNAYNKAVLNETERERFKSEYKPLLFEVPNAQDIRTAPQTKPVFRAGDSGNYYFIPFMEGSTYVVVPRFNAKLQKRDFVDGAMQRLFDFNPFFDESKYYENVQVNRPAIITEVGGNYSVDSVRPGELALGSGEKL